MALLGELTSTGGRVLLPPKQSSAPSISYAAQTPWLRNQSIRDNIVFETPFDAERYEAVVNACALRPDFDLLEDGDATEIGAG
jgi:ABC-type transport system involved in cytochrome bd biosynthesis fused ATPase/permease subunit